MIMKKIIALLCLTLFVLTISQSLFAASPHAFVKKVKKETPAERSARLKTKVFDLEEIKRPYLILDNPIIKKRNDLYGPVRFMHKKHAMVVNNDCKRCHHFRPEDPKAREITPCSSCHQESFKKDYPERVGLKAAFHLQCINCHRNMRKGPTSNCTACHSKNVPDHTKMVKLKKNSTQKEVTAECLRCHESTSLNILRSAHGKNFEDKREIDCLACHDSSGKYKQGEKNVNYGLLIKNIGHPTRKNCGNCHFKDKKKDISHANLNPHLASSNKNLDVHMGGMDFSCQSCHKTKNHRKVSEKVSCDDCHMKKPHSGGMVSHHLNMHSDHVACNTCHSPTSFNKIPEKTWMNEVILDGKRILEKPEGHIKNRNSKLYPFHSMSQNDSKRGRKQKKRQNVHLAINHEVAPKHKALSCAACHASLSPSCAQCHPKNFGKRTCNRCHQDNERVSYLKYVGSNLKMKKFCRDAQKAQKTPSIMKGPAIDFKKLGYKGDPVIFGGRFKKLPLGK